MKTRYSVRGTDRGVELRLAADYTEAPGDDEGSTHCFWVPPSGGYVYEEFDGRPGTMGRQLCEGLFGLGSCRTSTEEGLAPLIRRLARQHCDRIDRDGDL